ncbi:MAG: hypothetical protein AAF393_02210 [Pseudomonadota bacterium]
MTNKHDNADTIKRLRSGAIDTRHYIKRSHRIRSESAHALIGRIFVGRR